MNRFLKQNKGSTLWETVVSISLVACFITGLMLAWEFTVARERNLEAYWALKTELETAYEITHRALRTSACQNLQTGFDKISFTDNTGQTWLFFKEGTRYKMTHHGMTEDLIGGSCTQANFTVNGASVAINLSVAAPPGWRGNGADLSIRGQVLLRNIR